MKRIVTFAYCWINDMLRTGGDNHSVDALGLRLKAQLIPCPEILWLQRYSGGGIVEWYEARSTVLSA